MKIAFLIPKSDRSFLTRHVVDLAKDLVMRGHEVRIVSILKGDASGFAEEIGEDHITMNVARMTNGVSELAKLMKSGAPEVMVSASLTANCVMGLARKMAGLDFPMVFMDQEVPGYEVGLNGASRSFWGWMRKKCYPHAARIIVPSYEMKRRILSLVEVEEARISHVRNPGRGYFSPPIKAPHPWLTEARADPTFVAAGALDANSDFKTLIEGIRRAQKVFPCKAIILGEGPDKKKLFDYSKSKDMRGHIAFASDMENLHDYVYFADGFVSTALSSASPDVVIRAMEISSRVICTASPGGSREVLGEGRFGKMLRMQDPDALAYALYEAMQSPKMRPGEREVSRFDRTVFLESMEREINQAVAVGTAPRQIEQGPVHLQIEQG